MHREPWNVHVQVIVYSSKEGVPELNYFGLDEDGTFLRVPPDEPLDPSVVKEDEPNTGELARAQQWRTLP